MPCRDDGAWSSEVVAFWFDELEPKDWWRATPDIDATIRRRYATLYEALRRRPPDPSTLVAAGHLAAVIVHDQFPRHLFRGTAEAYATDGLALAMTLDAIHRDLDGALDGSRRHFLYMPLMHSEEPAMQSLSMQRFRALGDLGALRSATDHQATIARFGRFPQRNDALGRQSTPDEVAYLTARRRKA